MSPSFTSYRNVSVSVVSPFSYGTNVAMCSGPIAMYGIPPVVFTFTRFVLNLTSTMIDPPGTRTVESTPSPEDTLAVTFLTAGSVTLYTSNWPVLAPLLVRTRRPS